ncbi:Crp/Fnr family transcriptional regulator [Leisingera sp. SS27]|uniref:Crp/Fnr family transcriptional regulator n=1 Tax=unclassified Leisingera TaxID=2614906 RepID=UPI0021A92242|nr:MULTISPECIES: Crp/Fnr family transcriptional regulator [unclassified Leisingera]MDC0658678.1 Crp/Fnr family transcriptional regulator [Leisingera sp. SS27]UWQ79980.1 Crp/Fnr family transcriptional regulator [Leisingera sp. S132]
MKNVNFRNWLDHCSHETRRAVHGKAQASCIPKGGLIHEIADPAQELYFIESGTIRFGATHEGGKELIVRDLGAGDWFGFIGCLGPGLRPNAAYARSETRLRVVNWKDVEEIGQTDPRLWQAIAAVLAGLADHFYKNFENTVFLSLEQRLKTALQQISKWQNTRKLRVSQEELAAILGVTKEAVGLHLNALKAKGQVQLGYRSIHLLEKAGP